MINNKHKVFISYHHANDQVFKETLLQLNELHGLFIDASVDTGDIDENLNDDVIRQKIRDDYLKDSTVTIVLVGMETKNRKHVDWEIYSSMFNGKVNKQSGVLVVNLPITGTANYYTAAHGDDEKQTIYPENTSWISITSRTEYEKRYPYVPVRIIDNLLKNSAKVSITNWDIVTGDIEKLRFLINATFDDRTQCEYDLSSPMRRANS
ncbi:MAG: TIR domain-containing protein [Bacteroidetes bacterium]|nr:TIR domain-containing protein [Bacteroidota bacterium]